MMLFRLLLAALLFFPAFAHADTSAYEAAVAADGPCHWWKLNDSSGSTIVDTNGDGCSQHDLSSTGTPTLQDTPTGVVGGVSIKFNGSSQYIRTDITGGIGGSPLTPATGAGNKQHMSWEWWGYIHNGTQGTQTALASDETAAPAGQGWAMYMGGTGVAAVFTCIIAAAPDSGLCYRSASGSTLAAIDTWVYGVVTWDGSASSGTLKVYYNASLEATSTTGDGGSCCGSANWATMASVVNNAANRLTGNLQYAAIYGGDNSGGGSSKTLSQSVITAHYNAGIAASGFPIMGRRIFQTSKTWLDPYWLPVLFGPKAPEEFRISVPTFVVDKMNREATLTPSMYSTR